MRRCLWFDSHGVQIGLLVDPADESVLDFRPGHVPTALYGADEINLSDVLPGLTVKVQDLFTTLLL